MRKNVLQTHKNAHGASCFDRHHDDLVRLLSKAVRVAFLGRAAGRQELLQLLRGLLKVLQALDHALQLLESVLQGVLRGDLKFFVSAQIGVDRRSLECDFVVLAFLVLHRGCVPLHCSAEGEGGGRTHITSRRESL